MADEKTKLKSEETVEPVKRQTKKDKELEAAKEENAALKSEIEQIKEQMAALMERLSVQQAPAPVVMEKPTEIVHFLWQAEVAPDNVVTFGENGAFGRIVGKTGSFGVAKSDLSRVLDITTRSFLDRRWLIILDGLTQEEREALGVDYKEGEILDKKAFTKIFEMGDAILDIYPRLCDSHKEMIAKRYYEAWENKRYIKRETVVALNKMSIADGIPGGAFKVIIEAMNAADAN